MTVQTKVKKFSDAVLADLETSLNTWLSANAETSEVGSISYSWDGTNHNALIIYREWS